MTKLSDQWLIIKRALILVVDVLGLDFQFLFTGFTYPVVFTVNEGVIVDALAVILGAKITFHNRDSRPVRSAFYSALTSFSFSRVSLSGI